MSDENPDAAPPGSTSKPYLHLEIAHVLFTDIVGYSKLPINEQRALVPGRLYHSTRARERMSQEHTPTNLGFAAEAEKARLEPLRQRLPDYSLRELARRLPRKGFEQQLFLRRFFVRRLGLVTARRLYADGKDRRAESRSHRIPERLGSEITLLAAKIVLGNHLDADAVVFRRAARVSIRSRPGMWFTVDGELIGNDPIVFEVMPRALQFVVGKR